MFTFLTPSGLFGVLALLVPLAIHLWNRRPGREVAVGSLRWLAAGANRRLRNLKLEQLWLLLLRAALLAVLALALAGPAWRQHLPAERGQVLLSPELIGTPALASLRPGIDSLRRQGYSLRWLATGFSKVSAAAWRADSLGLRDSAQALAPKVAQADFTWARVQQAIGTFSGQPLQVVSTASLRNFQGAHAPLSKNITWQTLPAATTSTWVQRAGIWGDSLHLLVANSTENQTVFKRMALAKPQAGRLVRVSGLSPLRLQTRADSTWLEPITADTSAATSKQFPIAVRTRPVRVELYITPAYSADARSLQAGLRAASQGLFGPMSLQVVSSPPAPGASAPDWLFWLSDEPLPGRWAQAVKAGTQVWLNAAGAGQAVNTHLVPTTTNENPVAVRRQSTGRTDMLEGAGIRAVWTDAQGGVLLMQRRVGRGAYYDFHTRLNPAWSDLADSPTLPARLLSVLDPELTDATHVTSASQTLTQDQRALDPTQIGQRKPANTLAQNPAPQAFQYTDLRPWLVLATGLLFALERLLARRRETLVTSPV